MIKFMEKTKRILALTAVIVLVICAILTLVFAILDYSGVGDFTAAWKASAWCMVIFPCFIYAMLLIYNVLNKKNEK